MITDGDALKARAELSLPHWFGLLNASYSLPTHQRRLMDALERVARGECKRLIVSMPPRHGKSELCSIAFPSWFLGQYPDKRVLLASYGAALAHRLSRRARNAFGLFAPEVFRLNVADDSGSMQSWDVAGRRGGMVAVGVDGPATGVGCDCVVGSTLVSTEAGDIRIDALCAMAAPPKVWSISGDGRLELRSVIATRSLVRNNLVRVATGAAAELVCTNDHRIYVNGSFTSAWTAQEGGALCRLRGESAWQQKASMHGVPQEEPGSRNNSEEMRGLRRGKELATMRQTQGRPAHVLLEEVCRYRLFDDEATTVRNVWREDCQKYRGEVLLEGMSASQGDTKTNAVPNVRADIQPNKSPNQILREAMCGRGTLSKDDGSRELAMGRRHSIWPLVSGDAGTNSREGSALLCGLRHEGDIHSKDEAREAGRHLEFSHPSHQQRQNEQQCGQSDCYLPLLPFVTPQVDETDTIKAVESLGDEAQWVYDIQVDGNGNFFANSILVHNCGIIDDPHKDMSEASSAAHRDSARDWYRSVFRTRLHPGGAIVVVATRWHPDDLSGWLLQEADSGGEKWEVLNLPMLSDSNEPLWPGRYSMDEIEAIRKASGTRTWEALYQGRPTPPDGGIFKREWWRHWTEAPPLKNLLQSWDMAFKGTSTSDYVVGQVWARHGADYFLLDSIRGRMDFPATCAAVRTMTERWPQAQLKLVEDAANGPAVIAALRSEVGGLVGIKPNGGKEARASAVSALVEGGNVYLPPLRHAWVRDFLDEATAFPFGGVHDDQVDAMTQALLRLRQSVVSLANTTITASRPRAAM